MNCGGVGDCRGKTAAPFLFPYLRWEDTLMKKIYSVYCKAEDILVGIGFVVIVALTFMNSILRYCGAPIIVAEDVCLLLFSWVAFLGADVAMRYSRLVGMDMLVSKLSPKWQKALQILVYIIMIVILAILIRSGVALVKTNGRRPFNTLQKYGIYFGAVTSALPVGSAMMILTCLVKIGKVLVHFKEDEYNVRKDNPDLIGEENTGADEVPVNFEDEEVEKQ